MAVLIKNIWSVAFIVFICTRYLQNPIKRGSSEFGNPVQVFDGFTWNGPNRFTTFKIISIFDEFPKCGTAPLGLKPVHYMGCHKFI